MEVLLSTLHLPIKVIDPFRFSIPNAPQSLCAVFCKLPQSLQTIPFTMLDQR
jgi:hypothetical protein